MNQREQYTQGISNYLDNISQQLDKINETLNDHDCCILSDFDELQKLVSEAQNLAAVYYLQTYMAPYTDQYINLSLAAQHLSEKKQGALIALERKDNLEHYVHNGTFIGAEISHVLLETVFYPGNPLHDGGVIIKEDQIYSAGNIFPLTELTFQNRNHGTRHRAAIGLTEKTDAIVLVVSEETGRISFALNGELFVVRAK
jgi:uncharacterized protein (TIGR00159 family)